MKTGKSLVELATELQRRAGAKQDFVAKSEAISIETNDFERLLKEHYTPELKLNVGGNKFSLNGITHDQIGQHLNIPAAYYDRMLEYNPELLATNVNAWLAKNVGQKRMVRTLDGVARAFLSDKFRPIENEDLAEAILPILLDGNRFDIMSCEVTDRKLYLKVVDKSVNRELAKTGNFLGDGKHKIIRVAAPAITISNSEVGMGALSIQAGVYDSFCSNLATFSARSMKKYHVGARHDLVGDDIVGMLSAQTQNLTNAALMSQVRDVVTNAFAPEAFEALIAQIEGTTQDKIDTDVDVVKLVNVTGKKIGLTEGESKGVLQQLIQGADLTRFGLYNAVTRHAQDIESYDRASELERAGAAVVELPRGDWQQLVALAS